MATTVLGLKTFTASDPVDYNEINGNYNKIDNGVKTALHGRAAHNLLDNSWFVNPVNQRGKTSWADWNNYTVDRWIFRNNHVSEASVGVSGMSITSGSSEIYFEQSFDKSAMQCYIGKPLTLVFSTNEGLLIKKWTVVDGSYSRESIGNFQMTIGCLTNFWIDLVVPANKTINIYWAALYEGSYTADTLPAYVPKDNDLAECERYHVPIGSAVWMTGFFKAGEGLVVEIPAARNMRINNPTVVLNNPKAFTGTGWNDLTYRSFSISRHSAKIVFDFSDPSAAQASYGSAFLVIGIEAISADL